MMSSSLWKRERMNSLLQYPHRSNDFSRYFSDRHLLATEGKKAREQLTPLQKTGKKAPAMIPPFEKGARGISIMRAEASTK